MMRFFTYVSVFFLLLTSNYLHGQVMTFQDYEKEGNSISTLDSLYSPALDPIASHAVFQDRDGEFLEAWKNMLSDLATHLNKNGYTWGKPTRCFNRIYFNKDGRVDTFLYNFRPGEIDDEKQQRFASLVSSFIENYQLKIENPAKSRFSQCGPVTYADN